MKLVIEVEIQGYNGPDEEAEVLAQIGTTIRKVVALCELSVGTFITSTLKEGVTP